MTEAVKGACDMGAITASYHSKYCSNTLGQAPSVWSRSDPLERSSPIL